MVVVMKFGGSCFKSPESFKQVIERVREVKGENVVVTSAVYGVTDTLLKTANDLSTGDNVDIYAVCDELLNKHFTILDGVVQDEGIKERTRQILESEFLRLRSILNSVFTLGELTPKTRDHVLSFGERLSTPMLVAALNDRGIAAEYFTGQKAGIMTDSKFGKAKPLYDITKKNVIKQLKPALKKNIIPVVTGFIAADAEGTITTLGRGGSDFTATIIGYCLDAKEVWLWKDVDGFMTTDPKIEPNARLLPTLSYEEAIELAYFGSKVIQPQAIEPVMRVNVPVRIKNFQNPAIEGTIIASNGSGQGVKAVSMWKDIALVDIIGSGKTDMLTTLSKIFDNLSKRNIETVMFSQGSSGIGLSIIIPQSAVQETLVALDDLKKDGVIGNIIVREDMCTIAVVGKGLRSTPGIAGTVFNSLGKKNINVHALARGASEYTFSFVIAANDGAEAVKAIHHEFRLGKEGGK